LRSFVPSFGIGGTVQNEEFNAGLTVPAARNRLYWRGGLSWRQNESLTPGVAPLRSLWLETSIGYSLQRWLRVEGYYSRDRQDSQLAGGRVDRNRVGVQIVSVTSMRLR